MRMCYYVFLCVMSPVSCDFPKAVYEQYLDGTWFLEGRISALVEMVFFSPYGEYGLNSYGVDS